MSESTRSHYSDALTVDFAQVDSVTHSGPNNMVLYFTGATNILYTFGGHAVTV
jgi:hypothetical protein